MGLQISEKAKNQVVSLSTLIHLIVSLGNQHPLQCGL